MNVSFNICNSPSYKDSEDRITRALSDYQPTNETQSMLHDKVLLAWFRLRRGRADYWGLPHNAPLPVLENVGREEGRARRSFHKVFMEFIAPERNRSTKMRVRNPLTCLQAAP